MAKNTPKLTVALTKDSGSSSTDLITNTGAVTAKVGAAGDTMQYRWSSTGGKTWTTWTSTTGSIASPTTDGVWTLQVRELNKSSVVTTSSLTFTLDTTAPSSPLVTLVADTGSSITDRITSNKGITVSGVEAKATVQYSTNGTTWGSSFAASEGANTVFVRQVDLAGNVSAATSLTFTLDTSVSKVSATLLNDTGDSSTDGVTNLSQLTVSGVESGATVQYSTDSVNWTTAFTASEGANTVFVRQVDLAGNVSAATSLTFTLDTAVATPTVELLNDTANPNDMITTDGSIVVTGVEDFAHLEFSVDGGATWATDFAAVEGANTVFVRQIDLAGNVSDASVAHFVLDTTVSTASDINTTCLVGGQVVVDPSALGLSDDETFELIDYYSTGVTATMNSSGLYVFDVDPTAAPGTTVGFLYQITDTAGNISQALVTVDVQSNPSISPDIAAFDVATQPVAALIDALTSPTSGIVVDQNSVNVVASGPGSLNIFNGSSTLAPLGIRSGILLTSGTTPGTSNTSDSFGTDNGGAWTYVDGVWIPPTTYNNGDSDLDAVVNSVFQTQSYDATSISFEFAVTQADAKSISFDLVFGSDEYPEWVDQFVDCAAVIVNGVNYALFDHNDNAPLSVIGGNLSAGYFIDNQQGILPVEYDGVSRKLTILAPIHSGTNSIKIAIADTGDHILDSGIFLSNLRASNLEGNGVLVEDTSTTSGDDTVAGGTTSDLVDAGSGNDTVSSGGGDDVVDAGSGNDNVNGGSGQDVLTGGAGADDFEYTVISDWAAYDAPGDTITDFTGNTAVISDLIDLDLIDGDVLLFDAQAIAAEFGVDTTTLAAVTPGQYSTLIAQALSVNTDGTASAGQAQFTYNIDTGVVGFDADGTGSLQQSVDIVTLLGQPILTNTNFMLLG